MSPLQLRDWARASGLRHLVGHGGYVCHDLAFTDTHCVVLDRADRHPIRDYSWEYLADLLTKWQANPRGMPLTSAGLRRSGDSERKDSHSYLPELLRLLAAVSVS